MVDSSSSETPLGFWEPVQCPLPTHRPGPVIVDPPWMSRLLSGNWLKWVAATALVAPGHCPSIPGLEVCQSRLPSQLPFLVVRPAVCSSCFVVSYEGWARHQLPMSSWKRDEKRTKEGKSCLEKSAWECLWKCLDQHFPKLSQSQWDKLCLLLPGPVFFLLAVTLATQHLWTQGKE